MKIAVRLNRPIDEITNMHPRDLATMLDILEEDRAEASRGY